MLTDVDEEELLTEVDDDELLADDDELLTEVDELDVDDVEDDVEVDEVLDEELLDSVIPGSVALLLEEEVVDELVEVLDEDSSEHPIASPELTPRSSSR